MKKLLFVLFLAVVGVQAARADEHATPDQAKAMAIKAADFLKQNGSEKAFAAFNEQGGPFHDRDLYVFVQSNSGVVQAHGAIATLIGKNLMALKDVDGKPFIKEITEVKDAAWVDYKWQNPQTKAVEQKTTYVIRVGEYLVGVGAYK